MSLAWGCFIKDLKIEKGNFKFHINGNLEIKAEFEKIPIIGKTGSGKSSFLKAIYGLEKIKDGKIVWKFPNNDKIEISNNSIEELDKVRNKYFGFAFQDSTLTKYLSVKENLLYPLLMKGFSYTNAIKTIESEIVKYLTSTEEPKKILNQFPHELSGGQRQRISLFQSIIHDPYIILADEPTGSLDEDTREQIMKILYNWVEQNKNERLLIWVTHHKSDPINSKATIVLEVSNNSCSFNIL